MAAISDTRVWAPACAQFKGIFLDWPSLRLARHLCIPRKRELPTAAQAKSSLLPSCRGYTSETLLRFHPEGRAPLATVSAHGHGRWIRAMGNTYIHTHVALPGRNNRNQLLALLQGRRIGTFTLRRYPTQTGETHGFPPLPSSGLSLVQETRKFSWCCAAFSRARAAHFS